MSKMNSGECETTVQVRIVQTFFALPAQLSGKMRIAAPDDAEELIVDRNAAFDVKISGRLYLKNSFFIEGLFQMSLIEKSIDLIESTLDKDILEILLQDKTTEKNIIWATDDYLSLGDGYAFEDEIKIELITGEHETVIKPRVEKDKDAQAQRSKDKAEVFTPSWVCNAQNNLIDDAWFGKHANRFNKEVGTTWESTYARKDPNDKRDRIKFPGVIGKSWKNYVLANRIEISCGEAPYLTSRYDTVTGNYIKPKNRIGLLDRKLRVITENTPNAAVWLHWAENALQSTYGFEWQGDNVLLARENLLLAVAEYYFECFGKTIRKERLLRFADIISWNVWQMDGIKFVIPNSCHDTEGQMDLLGEVHKDPCPGCLKNDKWKHNGTYARIMDWDKRTPIRFIDTLEGGQEHG